jgi:hypothetical protein
MLTPHSSSYILAHYKNPSSKHSQNHKKTIMLFFGALEFKNTKNENLEPRHGDKPPNTNSFLIVFKLNQVPNYRKLMSCIKLLTMHFVICL